ncbi:DNA-directed DNA polymerase alpha subunit pol12 [Xylographa opegraphella]|nr:DNA-directed DNA polymerase alpha subunit pol12 [Xylographa opegraphella]
MEDTADDLNGFFVIPGESSIPLDILGELQSIMRLHSISAQELFYKWESYCMKMGSEETKLDLRTVRAFKKDVQEILERETRGKAHVRSADKRGIHATPRVSASNGDAYDMLDGLTPNTPRIASTNGASKRKVAFETPAFPKVSKSHPRSSPTDGRAGGAEIKGQSNGAALIPFGDRPNAGQIIETLNGHLDACEPLVAPPAEPRVKLTANTDLKKFFYKPLAMHLSEASEVLDDRIDEFMSFVQIHHNLEDSAFGNPASKSTSEIIAVGRIASDTPESKLNAASLVLETSRRTGAGLRVSLKVEALASQEFFPGQIVALRGINASGEYFSAREVLDVPLLPPAASSPSTLDVVNERVGYADADDARTNSSVLNVIVSSGPYTADDNLDFEPLHTLCEKASETYADAMILIGPLFDIEHPLLATGDFDLPDDPSIEPDKATLTDAFRIMVAGPLRRLAQAVPSITIILVPSVRDAVNKHVSWPQEPFGKKELGLPKQARTVSNPVTISLNEIVIGISAQDILYDLRREEVVVGKPKENNMLARLPRHVIQQRHFFPLFPPVNREHLPKAATEEGLATGMPLDISYLKLGEWLNVRPDVLILPSALTPFAKVVESVLVVNPGTTSKKRAAGTYAQFSLHPRKVTDEEHAAESTMIGHKIFERARVDVVRI